MIQNIGTQKYEKKSKEPSQKQAFAQAVRKKTLSKAQGQIFSAQMLRLVNTKGHQSRCSIQYAATYQCQETLYTKNNKLTGRYCGKRMCPTCNRIRSAEMKLGYEQQLEKQIKSNNLFFVTLTAKTVATHQLKKRLQSMQLVWRRIRKAATKQKRTLYGVRKWECNPRPNNKVHPHFHLLITGKDNARFVRDEWIRHYQGKAHNSAQDIRQADSNSLSEMFKYMTKTSVGYNEKKNKGNLHLKKAQAITLDHIFCAFLGKRIFQPFGGLKKVDIDFENLSYGVEVPEEKQEGVWTWQKAQGAYIDTHTGEYLLEDYSLPKKVARALKRTKIKKRYLEEERRTRKAQDYKKYMKSVRKVA